MSMHLSPTSALRRALVVLLVGVGVLFSRSANAQKQGGSNLPAPRLMTVMPPGGKIGSAVEVTFTDTFVHTLNRNTRTGAIARDCGRRAWQLTSTASDLARGRSCRMPSATFAGVSPPLKTR